ncbi:cell division protein ZapA [Niveispirillum lacus]|uniref:Cell division protein ZapA n=1 Tax=Niveispirillum lacus TaxID=1981099 RepID=A0A255YUI4_9PROT|nr:cell division protein ZapA [Niveispirillum lacus]OYQ32849.1 cell division protein ZapA [Niveispirillum lacus]
MRRVDFTLNGRNHSLNCEDGQEKRLLELAAYVDARMQELTGGSAGHEVQNLIATCIVLADELMEARAEAKALRSGQTPAPIIHEPSPPAPAASSADEAKVVAAVDTLAKRIEDIAARLERA